MQNKSEKNITICANCKHKLFLGDVWYDQFCTVSKRKLFTDPVTGKTGYMEINSFGEEYLDDKDGRQYEYCRDINNGNCQMFEKRHKSWLKRLFSWLTK